MSRSGSSKIRGESSVASKRFNQAKICLQILATYRLAPAGSKLLDRAM